MDLYSIIDIVIGSIIALLVGIQFLLAYLLPSKNTKWSFTKKVLDEIEKTDDKPDRNSKQTKKRDNTDNS